VSSMMPTTTITSPPTATATTSVPNSNPRVSAGSRDARANAMSTPTYIPTPPSRGVGTMCTSRWRGTATAPTRNAILRTTPVTRKVITAAVSTSRASSRMGTPAPPVAAAATQVTDGSGNIWLTLPVTGRSGAQGLGVDAEHLGHPLGRDRALAQDARGAGRDVDDGGGDRVFAR